MEKVFKVGDYVRVEISKNAVSPDFRHYIGYEGYVTRCDNGYYKLDNEPVLIKHSALQLKSAPEVTENEMMDLFQSQKV